MDESKALESYREQQAFKNFEDNERTLEPLNELLTDIYLNNDDMSKIDFIDLEQAILDPMSIIQEQ
jgi:hypothetical protein